MSVSYFREPLTDGGSIEYTDGHENNSVSHKTENNQQNSSRTIDAKVLCSSIHLFSRIQMVTIDSNETCSVHASILNE